MDVSNSKREEGRKTFILQKKGKIKTDNKFRREKVEVRLKIQKSQGKEKE